MREKEMKVLKTENRDDIENGSEWIWSFLILSICFGGWGSVENPRISEIEKKVARLEGQMSMIGGKSL